MIKTLSCQRLLLFALFFSLSLPVLAQSQLQEQAEKFKNGFMVSPVGEMTVKLVLQKGWIALEVEGVRSAVVIGGCGWLLEKQFSVLSGTVWNALFTQGWPFLIFKDASGPWVLVKKSLSIMAKAFNKLAA